MKQATVEQNATRNWKILSPCILQKMKKYVLEKAPWVWPGNHLLKQRCMWLTDPINYLGRSPAGLYRRGQRWEEWRKTFRLLGFTGSDVIESACNAGDSRFDPWVGKIPWRREWLSTPVFLLGEFHGQRNLVGYSPRGLKESAMIEQLTLFIFRLL